MMWDSFMEGLLLCLRLDTLGFISAGLVLGMFVGALPGFTTVMAMALVLPISFFLDPLAGIPFLIGVYKGGIFGGSIPAILISVPGTGAAVATTFDGPALTRKGQARKALDMALFASVIGDFSSDIIALLLIAPIALVALLIGPPELAAIIALALLVVAATTSGPIVKGLVMCFIGLILSMIGQDPLEFMSRFTFGLFELKSGIPLLPMMIGVFALPEIMSSIERLTKGALTDKIDLRKVGERLKWPELRRCLKTIFRSAGVGTVIGMCPGLGQLVASMLSYALAKNASKTPENFGKGELEGVAAAESANNAVNGPTLIPLLTLGIPGDKVTAILLGAFVAHGMRPGPQLINEHGAMIFAILISMVLANILFLFIGYICIPVFARIVSIRSVVLIPIIVIFAFAGSYVYRSDPLDLQILVIFGIFGYLAKRLDFDVAPMVMAFILGQILEYAFGQSFTMASDGLFKFIIFNRPVAAVIFALIPIILIIVAIRKAKAVRSSATAMQQPEENP